MDDDITLVKKPGLELREGEMRQMNASLEKEFGVPPMAKEDMEPTFFFLLKQHEEIVAFGGLRKTYPVIFDGQTYTIYGFVEVISNRKGEGYGKQVITTMRHYLLENDFTGFGFCMPRVQEFYRKCGFTIEEQSTQRFVYQKGEEKITNQDGQHIFYLHSSDKFMQNVLAKPTLPVFFPNDTLW